MNVKGDIPFICKLLPLFRLKAVLVHLYPAQKALQRRRPREVSKISPVAGWSQISTPLFKFLRGELAIAKKFGQYKQIKPGNCSEVTGISLSYLHCNIALPSNCHLYFSLSKYERQILNPFEVVPLPRLTGWAGKACSACSCCHLLVPQL